MHVTGIRQQDLCLLVRMASDSKYNSDLLRRQTEINEYSYQNKLDTLFVFQLVFIGIAFVCAMLFLNKQGIIPYSFVIYGGIITCVILFLLIVNRLMYTNSRRDSRYWNRIHFGEDGRLKSVLPAPSYTGESLQQMLDKVVKQLSDNPNCSTCQASLATINTQ